MEYQIGDRRKRGKEKSEEERKEIEVFRRSKMTCKSPEKGGVKKKR